MKKILFKTLSLLLAWILIAGLSTYAQAAAAETAPVQLNLAKCKELALANNYDLKLANKEIDAKKEALDEAKFTRKKLKNAQKGIEQLEFIINLPDAIFSVYFPGQDKEAYRAKYEDVKIYEIDSFEEYQVDQVLVPAAEIAYQIVQSYYDYAKLQINLLVEKQYNDVITAQKLLAVNQASLERAKYQHKLAQDAYDVGMKAKDDLLLAKLQIAKMQAECEKAKNALQTAEIELKKTIGLDLQTPIILEENWSTTAVNYDLADGIRQATAKRPEIVEKQGKEDIAKMNYDLAKGLYTPNVFTYRQIENEYQKAQLYNQQQRTEIEAAVRESYSNLQTAWTVLESVKDNVTYAEENLQIVTDRYEAGMETQLVVLQAQELLKQAEEGYVNALSAYQLALAKYRSDIMAEN